MKQHPIYNKERNEKADLLRVIAMLFVVVGHCLMYGVPNTSTHGVFQTDSATDMLLFLLLQGIYILTSTGVNCFVLLSGYFLIQRTDFRSSLLKIWIQTIFYSILLSGIACIAGKQTYAVHIWMGYLSPFPTEEYWFMAPYMALSVAAPFLARFGNSLNQRQYIGFLSYYSYYSSATHLEMPLPQAWILDGLSYCFLPVAISADSTFLVG